MEIKVIRQYSNEQATLGEMLINDIYECKTLEDKDRGLDHTMSLIDIIKAKVYGQTAIPYGRYKVEKKYWGIPHNKYVPTLKDVPGYTGVGIHSGATDKDTLGCILVGRSLGGPDLILNGFAARDALYLKIWAAICNSEEVWITVQKPTT